MRVLSLSRIKSMGGILICPSRASSSSAYINHYEVSEGGGDYGRQNDLFRYLE